MLEKKKNSTKKTTTKDSKIKKETIAKKVSFSNEKKTKRQSNSLKEFEQELVEDITKTNKSNKNTKKKPNPNKKTVTTSNNHKKKKKKTKRIIFDLFILVACSISFSILLSVTPTIELIGDSTITIDYNQTFEDPGATSKYFSEDYSKKITTTGKVDTTKVGKYVLTYNLEFSSYKISKERIVEVVDRKSPEITLVGEAEVNVCPNKDYEEDGVTALDEYDGDLTDRIITKKENNLITYSVTDLSGNETSVTRKITRRDTKQPEITLKGGQTIYIEPQGTYKEPGYSASDNCDGNITSKVKVTGSVDTSKKGEYTLTYTVTDASNKTSTKTRKVVVSEKTDPDSGVLKKGVIYLTFDDGPNSGTTDKILDVLKQEGVKATFFVTGNGPDSLIKRMYEEGHTVALHTSSHDYSYIYASEENYFADLKKVSDRVKRITGFETKILRFPGGSNNTISKNYSQGIMTRVTTAVLGRGYRYYDWNVDASDAGQCAKSSVSNKKKCVYDNVTKNLYKTRANIVLLHDVKKHTADAIQDIIRYGKEQGYTFEAIDMNTKMLKFKINN